LLILTPVSANWGPLMLRRIMLIVAPVAFLAGQLSFAQPMAHLAENNVQVAIIEVARTPQYTQVRLEMRAAGNGICWYFRGPNSPYLIAEGHRYHFLAGERITDCPQKTAYSSRDTMVLRFEPLPAGVHQFSLVEGEGGESQMINPSAHRNETFWNFLRVKAE
jgi:hypothetical protein